MTTIRFSCDVAVIDATDKPLTVTPVVNNRQVSSVCIKDSTTINVDIQNIDDAEYTLNLIISGKENSHTKIDNNGNIISSTELMFSNFKFDDISIDSIVQLNSLSYTHNFNGTSKTITEKFYNTAGCNGTIEFKFTTPIHIWLLENM